MRRLILLSLVAALVALGHSCEPFPVSARVVIELPPVPPAWEDAWGPARFRVSWRSAGSQGVLDAPVDPRARVTIVVPRSSPVVVRADPYWEGPEAGATGPGLASGEALGWAGGVWPAGVDEAVGVDEAARPGAGVTLARRALPVRFQTGSVAAVLWRLMEAGVDLRRFSVERLLAEVRSRLPDDPWALDVDRVAGAIAAGAMRASYVRAAARHPVGLVAPPGRWFARSPFVAPVTGGSVWPELPAAVTPFYSADGRRLIVEVDEAGRAWSTGAQ